MNAQDTLVMDGQAANTGEGNTDAGQGRGSKVVGVSERKTPSPDASVEEMRMQDNDLEQPDGQRSSLSLDDDGGTHFESHTQETVIRQGGPVRDADATSPTLQENSDDNDIVFNPIQRLNFDEDIEEDLDQEGSGREVMAGTAGNSNTEFRVVNGSDVEQEEASSFTPLAQDQGQNIRIIEGHDSSLLDDGGNSSFGFGFLQTPMVQLPLLSPLASSALPGIVRMDEDATNLYDSLEREDGSSPYRECQDHGTENSSSQYFSTNSVALMAANSHGQDSGETFWSQDENADHENFLSHPHQPFHMSNNHVTDRNHARQQSPPRNFQADASSMFMAKRRGGAYVGEGHMDGYGDVNSNEEDNTDGLSLELSEEGLLHNTQTYAQPVTANSSGLLGAVSGRGDMGSHPSKEWSSTWNQASNMNFDNTAKNGNPSALDSQPKNLAWNQSVLKDESLTAGHVDGVDVQGDERQAGAGSSSNASDQNQSAIDSRKAVKKPISSKPQTRRPAVQGSASAGDNKKAGGAIPRSSVSSSVVSSRKIAVPKPAGNMSDKSGRGNSVARQKPEPTKAKNSGMGGSGPNSRQPQGQASTNSPLASRTNSHTSLVSNASSTNSRVSGVGKESQMSASARGASQLIVGNESSLGVSFAHRQDGLQGEASSSMVQSNPLHSQSFDRIRPAPNLHQPEARATQSFSKSRTVTAGSDHPSQIPNTSGVSDHFTNSQGHGTGDQHLPPRPHDNQHRRNMAGGNNNSGNQNDQQQHMASHHLPYGSHQVTLQNSHVGFPIQSSMSPSGSEGSHHSFNRDAIVTQMEALKRQGHQLSPNTNRQRTHLEHDIQGMEEVRSHLHNMLRIGVDIPMSDTLGLDHSEMTSDLLLSDQPVNQQLHFDSETSSFMGNNPQENISEILENFPSFSSKMFSDMPGLSTRHETAVHGENQYLRDQLEKERYRRKHCEEHIQRLNTKLLEVQQQLAVAVSTDKRKDIMIEQLDKQLAKVVEGWKKREAEKDEFLRTVSLEKEQIEESLTSQQMMINNFESELANTVEELRAEKVKSSEIINGLKEEIHEVNRAKENIEETLEAEREKFSQMTSEWEDLKEAKELAEKRAQQAQERLIEEQDNWLKKEQQFQSKITEVKEANQKVINLEKVKVEEQKKKREEAESQNEELKTELKKAVLDLEQLIREKESQKVEMSIMEAKFESAQRKLEADLHGQMEKEIADQAREFHTRIETSLEEASERHRKQVAEIHSRHQRDMEKQAAALNEEREKKEAELHKQLADLEEKLQELRTENSNLKQSKIKLESQRMEILTKLQFMMQSQWNEAVSLLVSTPQKRSLNSSFLSNQSGGQLASSMPVTEGNPSVTTGNLLSSGPTPLQGQDKDGQGSERLGENASSSHSSQAPPSGSVKGIGMEGKHEEMNGRDKVEEYLQRLDQQMDIPMTRNDLQVQDRNHIGGVSVTSTATTDNNSLSFSYSNSHPHHQPKQHLASSLQHISDSSVTQSQLQMKASNNLSSSLPVESHGFGMNTGQTGSDSMPTQVSSHVMESHISGQQSGSHSLQAIAMRSPQQSYSRFNSETNQFSRSGSEREQVSQKSGQDLVTHNLTTHRSGPEQVTNRSGLQDLDTHGPGQEFQYTRCNHDQESRHAPQSYLLGATYGQGLPPPHHHRHYPQHSQHHHQRRENGPRHGHSVSFSLNSSSNSNGQRPGADDFGDHKDLKVVSGTGANVNLFSPDSPTYTSSPDQIHATKCLPNRAGVKSVHYLGSTVHNSETSMLTHSQDSVFRPVEGIGPTMKRQTVKSGQQFRTIDHLNDSLSPPVKQTAERDQPDSMSEASSGFHDPNRLHANYSQLSDRMEEHQSRQGELQHYVKMLLQKAPGSVYSEPERDLHTDHEILESSRELTVDLDLNDTATAAELTSQLTRLQTLREQQQQSARIFPGQNFRTQQSEITNQSNDSIRDHLTDFMGDNGVISAEGLSEISHLLNLYRENWKMKPDMAGQAMVTDQLMDVLTRGMAPGNSSEQMSRKEEKKSQEGKMSPRSHPHRKIKDLTKTRKTRSASQSGDTSITHGVEDNKATNSTSGRSASSGPGKKGTATQDIGRAKKIAGKQSGSKSGSGAVWK